jgi:hypothetical protein
MMRDLPNKAMPTDGRYAAAADRQVVMLPFATRAQALSDTEP